MVTCQMRTEDRGIHSCYMHACIIAAGSYAVPVGLSVFGECLPILPISARTHFHDETLDAKTGFMDTATAAATTSAAAVAMAAAAAAAPEPAAACLIILAIQFSVVWLRSHQNVIFPLFFFTREMPLIQFDRH